MSCGDDCSWSPQTQQKFAKQFLKFHFTCNHLALFVTEPGLRTNIKQQQAAAAFAFVSTLLQKNCLVVFFSHELRLTRLT